MNTRRVTISVVVSPLPSTRVKRPLPVGPERLSRVQGFPSAHACTTQASPRRTCDSATKTSAISLRVRLTGSLAAPHSLVYSTSCSVNSCSAVSRLASAASPCCRRASTTYLRGLCSGRSATLLSSRCTAYLRRKERERVRATHEPSANPKRDEAMPGRRRGLFNSLVEPQVGQQLRREVQQRRIIRILLQQRHVYPHRLLRSTCVVGSPQLHRG